MNNEVLIDPGNPGLGVARTPRVYHSTALLLPDARVFVIGGEDEPPPANAYPSPLFTGEIFSPPYLFQPEFGGARPNIFNAPPSVQFNVVNTMSRTFEIDVSMTDEANSIDRVVLLRPAAVTHHFDYDQRYIELKINNFVYNQWNPTDVEIHIESPQEDLGPAGYYMLFALEKENGKRVPSEAVFIKLNPAI